MTTNAITFGTHNPTLTTEYANRFSAIGYEVMDTSWTNDLTDSLLVTCLQRDCVVSFHIQIPIVGQFPLFTVTPYDINKKNIKEVLYGYDNWVRDIDKSKTIITFDGVIKELNKLTL